jgi:hypothetical protein
MRDLDEQQVQEQGIEKEEDMPDGFFNPLYFLKNCFFYIFGQVRKINERLLLQERFEAPVQFIAILRYIVIPNFKWLRFWLPGKFGCQSVAAIVDRRLWLCTIAITFVQRVPDPARVDENIAATVKRKKRDERPFFSFWCGLREAKGKAARVRQWLSVWLGGQCGWVVSVVEWSARLGGKCGWVVSVCDSADCTMGKVGV